MANIKVLVVGGGGAGGAKQTTYTWSGGGGGGGGVVYNSSFAVSNQQYTVTVGAGGIGDGLSGADGGNSVFSTITAYGGGRGGGRYNDRNVSGYPGGCGGGAGGGIYGETVFYGGAGSQGYAGGSTNGYYGAAGGGGMSAVGSNAVDNNNGANGGEGVSNSITGTAVVYGSGGGGGAAGTTGTGGSGGTNAGNGGSNGTNPTGGAPNTGGGGGGSTGTYNVSQYNGAGGSGIVVLRYTTADFGTNTFTGSPTVSTIGSETVVKFTESGSITFVAPPVVVPTVTTQSATNIATTSCTGNGNITATGGVNCTRRGFCYKAGTSGDPTISDSVAYDDGSFGTGAFTKSITGLTAGTDYRVRAYAVNSAGTSYGSTVDVKTLSAFIPRITWFN